MKKFITMGLLAAAVIGGAVQVQAEEACCPADGAKAESHISIAKGFQKLGKETGIYRFFNPQTQEEKAAAYEAALVKTVEAEISAGHFHGAMDQIHKAHGIDQALRDQLTHQVEEAEAAGYEPPLSLPPGLGQFVMILVGLLLIFLAIKKGFEPLLLLPIGFGAILTNIPMAGISAGPMPGQPAGFLYYFYTVGVESGVFPLLIFMGVGAMTDFGPLLANPKTALLGAAAQFGIFIALLGATFMGGLFTLEDAAAIGIIGGADGPTAIFLASRLSPNLLGAIAVAAYSYMALVPIIQPPIMRLLTTKEERAIEMKQLRHVSKTEKIVFPLLVLVLCLLLLPSATPLIGMLMLGNLMKESTVVDRLSDTAQNALINIVTIMLGLAVGSKLAADKFLNVQTLGILALGLGAFVIGTAAGVLLAKLMNKLSKDQINPLIGSAGVSAVPMAARVSNKVGLEANPQNFLLMHAMGPNVAGVIGSAVAAGVLLALVG
ncbi:Glutaconyl-CoA decarboxylase subunit beta [Pontiella desulfatans]|uniref:Glutaconyl-CoA decarboxylase subunit beta n=1 Tax=Pontiella desulfatans TaxID=2750659 RepID=A0A6C2TY95_PONDE|nr:sodium ion-translocating decarboxylase subunit beta [Pontiella desulfatans]VGO12321.1 Glutaconyl-CoA decarboxylase subunit beta [Pontiella desulfatans]